MTCEMMTDRQSEVRVIYADPLVFRAQDGTNSLYAYLRKNADVDRNVVLLHELEPELSRVFEHLPVRRCELERISGTARAAKIADTARALGATTLDLAVDVEGVDAWRKARRTLTVQELEERIRRGPGGAMTPVLLAARRALEQGVSVVRIGHPKALMSDRASTIRADQHERSAEMSEAA